MSRLHPLTGRRIHAARPSFSESDVEAILLDIGQLLRSGRLILGEHTHAFEEQFRQYVGTDHGVAVSSCTAALQIVMRFFRVSGQEVLLPTNNFPGVVSAVLYEGGIPVFADMDPATFCVNTEDLLSRITPRTRGVVVVHMAGLIYPDIDRLRAHCRQKGLFLIEDGSHAHGAAIEGRRAGSLADAGCFSFYPTKILTSALGGMITTGDADLAQYARSLRHHGMGARHGEFLQMGNDWCMSELHAIVGLRQLSSLDANVDHRRRVAGLYRAGLADADWITFPDCPDSIRHAYYKLPLLLREDIDATRFRRVLSEDWGVENGTVYNPPCHLLPMFQGLDLAPAAFPVAESTLKRQFCPPIHSTLTADEVEEVIQAMKQVVGDCRL